jgi:myosin-1
VLSADGKHCNFTALPVEAMAHLQTHGELPLKYIRRRDLLQAPVHNLLYGGRGFEGMVAITEANLFRRKLQYVVDVLAQWGAGGGLGCMPEGVQRILWDGPLLEEMHNGKKEEWITVGKFGGDGPRS